MITSVGTEKAFDKIQDPFIILFKNLTKLGIEGNFLTVIKIIYENSTANIMFNGKRLKMYPLRYETQQGSNSHHFYSMFY